MRKITTKQNVMHSQLYLLSTSSHTFSTNIEYSNTTPDYPFLPQKNKPGKKRKKEKKRENKRRKNME